MSAKPLTREERDGIQKYGVTLGEMYSRLADYEATVKAAEERAERAEKVVALFRFLDEVDESTTASEPLTGYVTAWDKVADLIESLDFDYLPVLADDAARGDEHMRDGLSAHAKAAEERAERLRAALGGLLLYARGNDHVLGLIHAALNDDAARGDQ